MIDDDYDVPDESYFEGLGHYKPRSFDSNLLLEPVTVVPLRPTIVLTPDATVTDAMRAMQRENRGCVLVTDDGTQRSKLLGIFTERDVLFRIVDRGRNPASLPIGEVMTPDPETLSVRSTLAYVLNKMSVGGFRHVPIVDDELRPACVVSVRDVVAFLVEAFPREVFNLPTEPGAPLSREGA